MIIFTHKEDWFYEGNVSAQIINYFKGNFYEIVKDNSLNTKAHGVDIIVKNANSLIVMEVKGYPSKYHTKGINVGKLKVTKPQHQAKHWFGEVIMKTIYNYSKYKDEKNLKLAIGIPQNDVYSDLIEIVKDYFIKNNLDLFIYFVSEKGEITIQNLNEQG